MTFDERTWRIVPGHLEGAGYFDIRMRAEREIRALLMEIGRLQNAIKTACPHGEDLLHGENVSIPASAYQSLCAALRVRDEHTSCEDRDSGLRGDSPAGPSDAQTQSPQS